MTTDDAPSRKLVFISFAGADSEVWRDTFKEELERLLKTPGEQVCFFYSASDPIMSGKLDEKIATALDASHALVSIIGPGYLQSAWCRFEIEHFFEKSKREERKSRFVAVCLDRDVFDRVEEWETWKAAGLPGIAKVDFYHADGATVQATLEHKGGKGRINEFFTSKVKQIATEMKTILSRSEPKRAADDPPPLPLIVIGATDGTFVDTFANDLERLLLDKITPELVRVTRLSMNQLRNDDPEDSEIAKELAVSALFVVPVSDEEPDLRSHGAGGHVRMQRDRWAQAKGPMAQAQDKRSAGSSGVPQPVFWAVTGVDVPKERRAKDKHANFLEGLPKLAAAPAEMASQVKQLLFPEYPPPPEVGAIAKIVVEDNAKAGISPKPLQTRMEKLWQAIQRELPATQGIRLLVHPMSVATMRKLKKDLGADAVILLWGSKDDVAVYAQVENVDRDCAPVRRFLAYLAPPQPKKPEEQYLGWELLPFRVRTRRNRPTVVKEFNVASAQMKEFLTDLAREKQRIALNRR